MRRAPQATSGRGKERKSLTDGVLVERKITNVLSGAVGPAARVPWESGVRSGARKGVAEGGPRGDRRVWAPAHTRFGQTLASRACISMISAC